MPIGAREILGFQPDYHGGASLNIQALQGVSQAFQDLRRQNEAERAALEQEAHARNTLAETGRHNLAAEALGGRYAKVQEDQGARALTQAKAEAEAAIHDAEQRGEHDLAVRLRQQFAADFGLTLPEQPAQQAPAQPGPLTGSAMSALDEIGISGGPAPEIDAAVEAAKARGSQTKVTIEPKYFASKPRQTTEEWRASYGANMTADQRAAADREAELDARMSVPYEAQDAALPGLESPMAEIGLGAPQQARPAPAQRTESPLGGPRSGYEGAEELAAENVAAPFAASGDVDAQSLTTMAKEALAATNGDEEKAFQLMLGLLGDKRKAESFGRGSGGGLVDQKRFLDATRMLAKDMNQVLGTKELVQMESAAARATQLFAVDNPAAQRIGYGTLLKSFEPRPTDKDRDFYLAAAGLHGQLQTKFDYIFGSGELPPDYREKMGEANELIAQIVDAKRQSTAKKMYQLMKQTPFFYENLTPLQMNQYANLAVRLTGEEVAPAKGRPDPGEPELVDEPAPGGGTVYDEAF